MDNSIIKWVNDAQNKGKSKELIFQYLLERGFTHKQISEILNLKKKDKQPVKNHRRFVKLSLIMKWGSIVNMVLLIVLLVGRLSSSFFTVNNFEMLVFTTYYILIGFTLISIIFLFIKNHSEIKGNFFSSLVANFLSIGIAFYVWLYYFYPT